MSLATFHDQPVWRVVPTRFPPISIFERAASPEDLEDNLRLEMAFSSHYGEGMRILSLPKQEWVSGPGCGFIMAPFVYPIPSRFSDGSFGVFSAGLEEATAIEEVAFHRTRFMASTGQSPMALEHQILKAVANGKVTDIRGRQAEYPELYDPEPDHYPAAQAWAAACRGEGGDGVAYSSVRRAGGHCAALFRPRAITHCRIIRPLHYLWNGSRLVGWA